MVAARQAEGVLMVVANDVGAGKSGMDVEPGLTDRVVVVPQQAGILPVRILVDFPGPFGSALTEPVTEPCVGPAVAVGRHDGAVQMHDGLGRRLAVMGAMQVGVEGLRNEKMAVGNFIHPANENPLSGADLKGRSGKLTRIRPERRRRQIAVQTLTNGAHRDFVKRTALVGTVRFQDRVEPGQWIDEFLQSGTCRRGCGRAVASCALQRQPQTADDSTAEPQQTPS